MKLHLLRHAKTELLSFNKDDFHRKLLPKGITQANMMGQFLYDHRVEPKEILCSDAVRTRQTLQVMANFIECPRIQFRKELYLADKETYLNLIWSFNHKKDVLIVGHNEGISELASYLSGEEIRLKTCGFVTLDLPGSSWKETSGATGTVSLSYRPQVYFPD